MLKELKKLQILKITFIFVGLLSANLLISCGGSTDTTSETTDSSSSGSSSIPDNTPLYVTLTSNYEKQTSTTFQGSCAVVFGTATGTTKSCTFHIPQMTLYFSDLKFTVGTKLVSTCKQVSFEPYYYLHSTSATYASNYFDPTITSDCSKGDLNPAVCYGGAATQMITGFPKAKGMYILPAVKSSETYTVKAANTYAINGVTERSVQNNTFTSNSLSSRIAAITPSASNDKSYFEGGVDNFVDYRVKCYDEYNDPLYQIVFTIYSDLYPTGGSAFPGQETFYAW